MNSAALEVLKAFIDKGLVYIDADRDLPTPDFIVSDTGTVIENEEQGGKDDL